MFKWRTAVQLRHTHTHTQTQTHTHTHTYIYIYLLTYSHQKLEWRLQCVYHLELWFYLRTGGKKSCNRTYPSAPNRMDRNNLMPAWQWAWTLGLVLALSMLMCMAPSVKLTLCPILHLRGMLLNVPMYVGGWV